jgi:MtaA/CmuA family methyltransferase
MNSRERVLAHLSGQPVDQLPLMPITMMFAADRIGKSYRSYVTDHRVLVEGQLRVARDFETDHVSAISDPAREASDLGAPVAWFDDQPPALDETDSLLSDKSRLGRLAVPDPHAGPRMSDRIRGVALLRERTAGEKLVEGWVEGPCAMAADLRGINALMTDFYDDPPFVRSLFEFAVEMELRFARAQVEAGADLIGIGDAAASLVGPELYEEFVRPLERRLVEGIRATGAKTRLHICGRTRRIFAGMGSLGADIIDLDSPAPLEEARREMPADVVLLGNLDPVAVLRNGTHASITAALSECRRGAGARWIVGAGCEVVRDTPDAHLGVLRDFARNPSEEGS